MWWRGAVVYQIYPRSFADGSGDGVGDLAGATAHLPYVASLGVDAVWLSPVFVSPMVDNGYDVSDYRDIDPLFGTLADFDAFVAEAHRLRLKVILDQVYSHTSDRHPWFADSRAARDGDRADWYVWADPAPGGGPPNNWQCWFGEAAWSWAAERGQYYLHNFHPKMPDLNFWSQAVVEETLSTVHFWLDRGVDGLRLDVCNYYRHDPQLRDNPPKAVAHPAKPFELQSHDYNCDRPENLAVIEALRETVDAYPDRFAIGEIVSEDNIGRVLEYTSDPTRLHSAYSFAFLRGWPGGEGFAAIMDAYSAAPEVWPSFAFSNHDTERVASRWAAPGQEPAAARLFLALLMCMRGTVFLYQGEELGLTESEVPFDRITDPSGLAGWPRYKGRDGCRTPFPWTGDAPHLGFSDAEPWLPAEAAHTALAVGRQQGDETSTLAFARALIAWRKATPALRDGDLKMLASPGETIAFARTDADGTRVVCVFNPSAYSYPVPPEAAARAVFQQRAQFARGALWLAPYGFAISVFPAKDHSLSCGHDHHGHHH
jgi:alpha-glucosidase